MDRWMTQAWTNRLVVLVTLSVLGIFVLLNFWQNRTTVSYKDVVYKINPSRLSDVHAR